MSNYTKQKLISNLNGVYDIHVLGLASATFLLRNKALELLKQNNMMYYGQVHFLKELADELNVDSVQRTHRTSNLISSSKMFFLIQPINILNEYFEINNLDRPYHENWYAFGNTIRNYLTHGSLDINKISKKITIPISWNGNIITKNEICKGKIEIDKFSNTYPLELYNNAINFAKNLPDTS